MKNQSLIFELDLSEDAGSVFSLGGKRILRMLCVNDLSWCGHGVLPLLQGYLSIVSGTGPGDLVAASRNIRGTNFYGAVEADGTRAGICRECGDSHQTYDGETVSYTH